MLLLEFDMRGNWIEPDEPKESLFACSGQNTEKIQCSTNSTTDTFNFTVHGLDVVWDDVPDGGYKGKYDGHGTIVWYILGRFSGYWYRPGMK